MSAASSWLRTSVRIALAALLVVAVASAVRAETPLPAALPGRAVHDGARVMTAPDAEHVEQRAAELFDRTGVAIVVVTVPRLVDETIDELAVRVGTSWGVGRRGEDRGVVIALAVADDVLHVATGYGVESYLNDAKVGRLIDEHAMARLRRGERSAALRSLVDALAGETARHFGVDLGGTAPDAGRSLLDVPDLVATILGLAIFAYLLVRHPRLLIAWLLLGLGRGGGGSSGRSDRRGGGGFGGGGAGRTF
jgi:uncharacterized protein